jgi:cobalamin biosynthesis Mg chelatase CobN
VLALLAFACFPLLAHAESSSGIQYSDAPPTATGKNTIPTQTEPSAHSSKKNGGAATPGNQGSNGGGGSGGGSSKSHGGSGAKAGNGAEQQGNPGKAGANGGSGNSNQNAHGEAEPASQESGGSSPLVPILIAIAVLAAISIGAVVIRRRRGSGAPVSPEAG